MTDRLEKEANVSARYNDCRDIVDSAAAAAAPAACSALNHQRQQRQQPFDRREIPEDYRDTNNPPLPPHHHRSVYAKLVKADADMTLAATRFLICIQKTMGALR